MCFCLPQEPYFGEIFCFLNLYFKEIEDSLTKGLLRYNTLINYLISVFYDTLTLLTDICIIVYFTVPSFANERVSSSSLTDKGQLINGW